MAEGRVKPNVDYRQMVCNYSSRNGASPKLIVIHSTEGSNIEGIGDLKGLANWFDRPSANCSSNVGVDAEGNSSRMVRDEQKAWTQAYWNPWSLSIENIGFASQKKWTELQLKENARWIAYWCDLHGIRPYKASVTKDGRIVKPGVIRHSDLGALGGGHHDPGSGFDLSHVMDMARSYLKEY
jgi:N-acetylmuramoyl-L-alanine amidase